jgi:hypothetical protein
MAKKSGMAEPSKADNDFQTDQDAHHLSKAMEIHADPARHKKAVAHLKKKAAEAKDAHDAAKDEYKRHQTTKEGLNKAFPDHEATGKPDLDNSAEGNE